ncbi:hypothetical protein QJS10_CPA07g01177 [Acorus calamus]|uniref:Uncharacterized protein n=1 Tax=Acorus calamus TaxID=4465 RepID=A0AAV9EGJ6_ACOCL|nr:hypothetical protein QJS10_CPA07g01177 [Acorus calamus]
MSRVCILPVDARAVRHLYLLVRITSHNRGEHALYNPLKGMRHPLNLPDQERRERFVGSSPDG